MSLNAIEMFHVVARFVVDCCVFFRCYLVRFLADVRVTLRRILIFQITFRLVYITLELRINMQKNALLVALSATRS